MSRLFQPAFLPVQKANDKYDKSFNTNGPPFTQSSTNMSGRRQLLTSELRPRTTKEGRDRTINRSSPRPKSANLVAQVSRQDDQQVMKSFAGSSTGTRTAAVPIPSPAVLRKELHLQMRKMLSEAPLDSKLTGVGAKRTKVSSLGKIATPSGPQQILHKMITEKRVERTKYGEFVVKSFRTIGTDSFTGQTFQIEEELQKIDPDYPCSKGNVKEIIFIGNERNLTASYVTSKENMVKETTKLNLDLGLGQSQLKVLVREETEDVVNILQNEPVLVNQASELFPLKKRAQELKVLPKRGIATSQMVSNSLNADIAPEIIATIMSTSETGGILTISPQQIYSSLFTPEDIDGSSMILSPPSPGPLADAVVPTFISEEVHEEMLSSQMEEVSTLVHVASITSMDDSFSKKKPGTPRKRSRRRRPYKSLIDEDPPWNNEALIISVEAVGAHPSTLLHASNVLSVISKGSLLKESSKGIEYILDCHPYKYCSRVQFRGSQPPPWFPGYMMALPNTSEGVRLAKSPSEVLMSAWKSVQPDVFSDDSIVYN